MDAIILLTRVEDVISTSTEYIIGAMIALVILGFLIYTLIKPEKF